MILGVLAGVGIAIGEVSYLAGAARSLADDAQRVVGTGGSHLITSAASRGAPRRVVLGATALVAVLVPGITAFLLVLAARGTLRVRAVVAVLLAAVGAAAFAYQAGGNALGVMALALIVGAVAVALTGPLVIAPLCALAALIGAEFLPRLLSSGSSLPNAPVAELHRALLSSGGSPLWLRVVVLIVAVVPFAFATRLVLRA